MKLDGSVKGGQLEVGVVGGGGRILAQKTLLLLDPPFKIGLHCVAGPMDIFL